MRVDEVFKQAASQGTAPVSFEMFPPKGELTLDTAREVAGNLCKLSPSFVSVTCSAGRLGQRRHHRPHRAYDYERIRYALGGAPHLCGPYPRRYRRQDR